MKRCLRCEVRRCCLSPETVCLPTTYGHRIPTTCGDFPHVRFGIQKCILHSRQEKRAISYIPEMGDEGLGDSSERHGGGV